MAAVFFYLCHLGGEEQALGSNGWRLSEGEETDLMLSVTEHRASG